MVLYQDALRRISERKISPKRSFEQARASKGTQALLYRHLVRDIDEVLDKGEIIVVGGCICTTEDLEILLEDTGFLTKEKREEEMNQVRKLCQLMRRDQEDY